MKEILQELKIKNEYLKITTQRLISDKQLKVLNNMQKEFTNIVCHEMKTPIYAIIGYALLKEEESKAIFS
jgi:signal transduction histidine kinase